ncbi:HXXEE domain-containing protein [Methylobacterium sp. J-026]|uniref:HXXEE domain-containing protein n=1 Tax=Methylobacterium sp. J-026 TaxID=2836624 RepID=UPI001FBA8BC3|nr:HXXEE domain-containing protein [Methylobacterium sp. J-026]MCJ2135888.1 HXXEE domain-containing protein [Methylobacterium sp. J-026]
MAASLLIVAPPVLQTANYPVVLLYLLSPAYMLHQVEEHAGDRFRTFINAIAFGGRLAMTPNDVLVINVGLVWAVNAAALYVGIFAEPGYALVAPYAMLVNAIGHLIMAGRFRRYNPGVVTGVVIFLPLSLAMLVSVSISNSVTIAQHVLGLAGALAIHILIAANAVRRIRVL